MRGPTTPYYLAGSSAHRYHQQKAQKHSRKAVGYAAAAAAVTHPGTRQAAIDYGTNSSGMHHVPDSQARAFGAAIGFAAAGHGAMAGAHQAKANKIKKVQVAKQRKAVKHK